MYIAKRWKTSGRTIACHFESLRRHVPMTFQVLYICEYLVSISFANDEEKDRNEEGSHSFWKTREVPNPHWVSVAYYRLSPLLSAQQWDDRSRLIPNPE